MSLIKKIIFVTFSLFFLFLIPLYFSLHLGKFKEATAVCSFSIILLVALNHRRIRGFKLWGLEAELQEVIDEANATISQLKEITTSVSKAAITTMMSDSFLGGMTLRRRDQLYDEILVSLKKIKFSEVEIKEITADWRKGICLVYGRVIRNKLFKQFVDNNNQISNDNRARLSEEYQALGDFEAWRAPTPDHIEEFIRLQNWSPDESTSILVSDYRFFIASGYMRNKDLLFREWK